MKAVVLKGKHKGVVRMAIVLTKEAMAKFTSKYELWEIIKWV